MKKITGNLKVKSAAQVATLKMASWANFFIEINNASKFDISAVFCQQGQAKYSILSLYLPFSKRPLLHWITIHTTPPIDLVPIKTNREISTKTLASTY